MATVQYELDPDVDNTLTYFTGTVKECEDWIARREAKDPEGVAKGHYTIEMTEAEEAAYQKAGK